MALLICGHLIGLRKRAINCRSVQYVSSWKCLRENLYSQCILLISDFSSENKLLNCMKINFAWKNNEINNFALL